MKRNSTLVALFGLVTIASCGYKASNDSTVTTPQNSQVPAGFPVSNSGTAANNTTNQASQETQANGGGASTSANPAPAPSTSSAALNPAHGQPGHRCDIAVGAPLDSKPTTTATTTATTPTTTATTPTITPNNNPVQTVATAPAKTGAGLNPAHGQPGHRCDIAVGAPLDSKPTTAASTTPVSSTPVMGNSPLAATPVVNQAQKTPINPLPVTPIISSGAQTAPAAGGAGLNPAHGQPGHRCDLAVGAPLNGKPAATPAKQ